MNIINRIVGTLISYNVVLRSINTSYLGFTGLIIISFLFFGCLKKNKVIEIVLENKSSIELVDKGVEIKRNQLHGIPEETSFPLLINADKDTIPVQLVDMDGDDQWDELFFVMNLPPEGTCTYLLKWSDYEQVFPKRTSVRFGKRASATSPVQPATRETLFANELPKNIGFQRYQTDGPSWENDKVGFRHYLDGRNAKDLFGKKVTYMSPEDVGINSSGAVEDNYHVMAEWGRDILSVGNSVGIGGIALMIGDNLKRLGVTANDTINNVEETNFRIFSEGAVKSVINFQYINWTLDERKYFVDETTSIWPGMYAYNNKVKISGLHGDETLLIGLVNIDTEKNLTEIKVNDRWVVLFTHDKQTYEKEWFLGLAPLVGIRKL